MLVVIEGPDGAGKTTLAKELVTALSTDHQRVQLLHRGPPYEHPLTEYAHPLYTYRPGRGDHLVIDRWHIGELVYPRILNRPTELDEPTLRYIELVLMSRGAVVVHLTQHTEVLIERVGLRGDDLIKLEQLDEARKLFIDVFRHVISTPKWHLTGIPTGVDVAAIVQDAWTLERLAFDLNKFTTYVGSPEADVLLFGDVRGPRNKNPLAPAFVPYPSTSGHYLLSALVATQHMSLRKSSHLDWRRIGLANACDTDDPLALWTTLGKPTVVALGANAHRKLNQLAIPHLAAPHPQWVRRFHNKNRLEYGRYLLGQTKDLPWNHNEPH